MTNQRSAKDLALLNVLIGVIATVLVAVLFQTTRLDLFLQGLAYSPVEPHWPYATRQPWRSLHDFGTLPGLVLALGATIALGASFASPKLVRWRQPALFFFLLMALGPGLVTNILGKVFWGRPRPDEILQFAGPLAFHHPLELGTPGKGYSFLCGHCSMGFLFAGLFFVLGGWKRWAALAGGIAFGLLIGAGRVVQAAHFPSDILLDGTVMFILIAAMSPIASSSPLRYPLVLGRWKVIAGTTAAAGLMLVLFLFSTPVNKERVHRWVESAATTSPLKHETVLPWNDSTQLSLEVEKGDVELRRGAADPLRIRSLVKGFGFPGAETRALVNHDNRSVSYRQWLTGFFWEVHGRFEVSVAEWKAMRLQLRTGEGAVKLSGLDPGRTVLLSGSFAMSDARKFFRPAGSGRFIHQGDGDPIVISVQADKVVVAE